MTEEVGNRSGNDAGVDRSQSTSTTAELATVLGVLEDAAVPVALLDSQARVLQANAPFARVCGRPSGELHGERLSAWVIDDDRATVEAVIGELADGAASATHGTEARLVGADGRVRPMSLHLGLLGDTPGVALMCIAHDRSAERRRERSDRSARMAEATADTTDTATGLPNRKGLDLALASAARRSNTNQAPYALIRCELGLDDDAGEATEVSVAELQGCIDRVRQRLRPADTVALVEPDVLVVVAEDLHDEQDAAGVAYRLLSTVVEPVPSEQGPVGLRMVIGVAMADGATPPHALAAASTEAALDAREPGGFKLMDLRGLDG